MAPPPRQPKNRRRKKRRTEDFSSDSDSSSSDGLSDVETQNSTASAPEPAQIPEAQKAVDIDNIDIDSEPEEQNELPQKAQEKLKSIKFTTTEGQPYADARDSVKKDRSQLESEYLAYMAGTFADDLDQLRKKPDFTDKSIVLLAKTLQSGSNMFDSDTLDALLKSEK